MSAPDVFYNREDLWTIASEVGLSERRDQATQTMSACTAHVRFWG